MSSKPTGSAIRTLAQLPGKLAGGGAKYFVDLATLVGGQVIAKAVGLLAFAYLARVLDAESYGEVEFVVGLAGLFGMVFDVGLTTIGVRRAAAAPEKRGELATQVFLIRFGVAVLCALVMVAGVNVAGGSQALHGLVMLYALSLLFSAFYQEWLLQSAGLMAQIALAQILRMSVFFAAVLLLVHRIENVVLVGVCEIVGISVAAVFALHVQRRRIAPVRFWTAFKDSSLLREALPIGLATMIWSAAQYLPLFFMGALVGGPGVGFFAGATRLAASVAQFSFVYHFNLYATASRIARESSSALTSLMQSSFRVTAWVTIGGGLFVSLAASQIVMLIFGQEFAAAAVPLAILIWTVPCMFLAGHTRWSLILAHLERDVFRSQVAGLLVVLALGTMLIPQYAEIGAAISALGGNFGVWASSYTLARCRKVKTPTPLLTVQPLMLACALGFCAALIVMPAWAEAFGALVAYALLAPLVDRSLVREVLQLARAGHHELNVE